MAPRLKRLELHGYKTFANKTVFEFPGNITAIVGPNGSGKSNIADSIRWVLGEQTYSILRGKKTEDMIFTGSEDRPRASMASALILFDNEDGWLPIDFSEVSISRRAYRDGENEYLLNNQKVRLKEVAELLAQTGLAERTYTVIGQGLVDMALSLKPDERRKFFEEAAGIGLYRGRREEALNRLENTRRNLERINDIVTELIPRQRSLEKQVKKVQEYERIRIELQILLREWYGFQWHNSQRELNHAKEFFKNQDHQYKTVQTQLMEIEKQYEQFKKESVGLREKLDGWHLELSDHHRLREQTSRNLAVIDERLAGMRDKRQNQLSQLYTVEESEKVRKTELAQIQSEAEKQTAELSILEISSEELRNKIKSIEVTRTVIESELKNVKDVLIGLENQNTQQTFEETEKKNQIQVDTDECRSLEKILGQLALDLNDNTSQIKSSQKTLEVIKTGLGKINEDLEQKNIDKENTIKQLQECTENNITISSELSKLDSQKVVFEEAEKKFMGFKEGAKSILEAAGEGKLKGKYLALLSQLEIPEEFEEAIEAALGENIDSIIFNKDLDLEHALAYMETSDQGRVIFIHTEGDVDVNINFEKGKDVFGLASELIHYANELEQTVRILLGRYLIVKDRAVARKISRNLPTNCGAVTLKGEVFLHEGIIIAGKGQQRSRISRPRIKNEIDQSITRKQTEFVRSQEQIQTLKQIQDELEKVVQSLSEQKAQTVDKQLAAEKEFNNLTSQKEQIAQKRNWLEGQLGNKRSQIEVNSKRINMLEELQSANRTKISALKQKLSGFQEQLKSLSIIELQTQSIEQETQIAVISKAKDAVDQRLREKQSLVDQDRNKIIDLKEQVANLETELASTENSRHEMAEKEKVLNQKLSEIQALVAPAEKELVEKEKINQEFVLKVQNLRQTTTNAERYMTQAQLEVSRNNDKLERLREKIEDDFGLVSFPYATNISGPAPLPFEGIVEQLLVKEEIPTDLEDNITQQRSALRRIGPINQEAEKEYQEVRDRIEFLNTQIEDLKKADADLRQVIAELDSLMKQEFRKTFDAVAKEFAEIFSQLFIGGHARLSMIDNEEQGTTGVDIEARLPGRREQGLSLLSGGERSLTAVALIFALLRVSPTPFCVLDEVDAMLDESNVGRFCEILTGLSKKTQFIVITHNRNTVQVADVIYGVTMGKDSASQVISLKMDEISDELVQ